MDTIIRSFVTILCIISIFFLFIRLLNVFLNDRLFKKNHYLDLSSTPKGKFTLALMYLCSIIVIAYGVYRNYLIIFNK